MQFKIGIGGPQGLNRYAYVLNNPLKYVDPTGNFVDPVEKKEKDRSGEIDKMYNEVMQGAERTKQNLDEGAKELGGTVSMDREMRFEYEDEGVNDLARAGRVLGAQEERLENYPDSMGVIAHELNWGKITAGAAQFGGGILLVSTGLGMGISGYGEIVVGTRSLNSGAVFAGWHTVAASAPFYGAGALFIKSGLKDIYDELKLYYHQKNESK